MKFMKSYFTRILLSFALCVLHVVVKSKPGSPDPTFDTDGIVLTSITGYDDLGYDIAIQSDGKIVMGGYSNSGMGSEFVLVRYHPDGALDASFDFDGKLTTTFGSTCNQCMSVAIQSDGKIIAAGFTSIGSRIDFAVARYHTDGSLDSTFDLDGKVTIQIGTGHSEAKSVAIQDDGKIVVFGDTDFSQAFAVVRYEPDGSLDSTFDSDGIVISSLLGIDVGKAVAIQSDGKIVAAGFSRIPGSSIDIEFAVVRYNADGSPDLSFSSDGVVTPAITATSDYGYGLAIQNDGKIILVGHSRTSTVLNNRIAVLRFNSDGTPDSSFSSDGMLNTIIKDKDRSYSVVLQDDGKIVVAGNSIDGMDASIVVLRYLPDGSLDNSFDTDGIVHTYTGAVYAENMSILKQPDGKIVVAGSVYNSPSYNFFCVRYLGDDAVGNMELVDQPAYSFYPNPFSQVSILQVSRPFQNATLSIYNTNGQLVRQMGDISGNSVTIDRGNLPAGIYMFQLTQGTEVIAKGSMAAID